MSGSIRMLAPAVVALALPLGAAAQSYPPGPPEAPRDPICLRLESQLAALDRGIDDPAGGEARRYEEAVSRQQAELDRTLAQSRQMGCEGLGFFLFGRGQSPQCVELNNRIQRMRGSLDRAIGDLQRIQSGSADRGEQRRGILAGLAANDCGPQYRAAAPPRPRGFFETLFGGPSTQPEYGNYGSPDVPQSSTYRTLCVRTCDGYYFPISFSTVPAKFPDDERMCQRMCPAAEVALYTHRNPGEDVSRAVSLAGRPYTQLPAAFRYRQELNPACSCRRPGQSWAEALGPNDTTIERGDIIVTEEKSKAFAQPKPEPPKPVKPDPRRNRPGEGSSAAASPPPLPGAPVR